MKYYNKIKLLTLRNRGLYFLYRIPIFYRQTNVIYSCKSKWTNVGQHFAYEYSFGSWEQEIVKVISFINSVQYQKAR